MNELYSEAGQEPEWCPASTVSEVKESVIAAKARVQADTLDSLAKFAAMAKRVHAMVTAYEEIADTIQEAWVDLNMEAITQDMLIDGIPDWWKEEIYFQRRTRKSLVDSYRNLAARIANEFGTR